MRALPTVLALAVVVAGAAALSACDDEESAEDEIAAVFDRYKEAVANEDGATLCREVLHPSMYGSDEPGSVDDQATDPPPEPLVAACAKQFQRALGEDGSDDPSDQTLGPIRVHGDSASARVQEGGKPFGVARFATAGDRWYLLEIGASHGEGLFG